MTNKCSDVFVVSVRFYLIASSRNSNVSWFKRGAGRVQFVGQTYPVTYFCIVNNLWKVFTWLKKQKKTILRHWKAVWSYNICVCEEASCLPSFTRGCGDWKARQWLLSGPCPALLPWRTVATSSDSGETGRDSELTQSGHLDRELAFLGSGCV